MLSVMFVVIVFCWLKCVVGSHTFCVASEDTPPLDKGCNTIDYYASHGFIDNSEFLFLPGIHNLSRSLMIFAVSNVTFVAHEEAKGKVTIECIASGVIFQHVTNLTLENLSFISCGQPLPDSLQRDNETAQAGIAFGEVTNLRVQSVSVSHSHGYGILGHCVHGNFVINGSYFFSNKGGGLYLGGNVAVEYINCSKPKNGVSNSLVISFSQFIDGGYDGDQKAFTKYSGTLATGLSMILSQTNTTVLITDVTMRGNNNSLAQPGFGGNLFIHFFNDTNATSNSVTVQNSKLLNGVAYVGGGISASFHTDLYGVECRNRLTIHNTTISHNHAVLGGGMYINFQLKYYDKTGICPDAALRVTNCTFERNIQIIRQNAHTTNYLGKGVAVHIANTVSNNRLVHQAGKHFKTLFEDCIFQNSTRSSSTQMTVGGFNFALANGDANITNCRFVDNELTALGGYRAKITLAGDVLMLNNTGMNGGGLVLCESSYVVLSKNTHLVLIDNYATVSGGGIYIEKGCPFTDPFCPIQIDVFALNCSEVSEVANILMINNTAGYAGDHIYGGSFEHCKQNTCSKTIDVFKSLFSIFPNATSGGPHLSAVASDPERVCFCVEDEIDCKLKVMHYPKELFPGERATFSVVIVGQFDGTVPGTLLIRSDSEDAEDIIRQSGRFCKTLHISATSRNKTAATIQVHLTSRPLLSRNDSSLASLAQSIQVHVTLKPCPPGFEYSGGKCDCIEKLKRNKVHCDITSQTITRIPPAWIGYVNGTEENSGIVYHNPCPYDYCVDSEVNITSNETSFRQDLQCASDRAGFMCSKCRPGFSESVGSTECLQCRTELALPLTIVGYLISGILLVLFLTLFNVTYTDGMLSGLVFYLHVINQNSSTFLPRQHLHPVFIFLISWQELSGINYCLYDGMDSYSKAWLKFLFPSYLFAITAIIILMSRKFKRCSRLIGKNIIKVLATLLLLSSSQLVHAVVAVLSFTPVHYHSLNTSQSVQRIVWLSDPTLEYFVGKHFPLALMAIVFALLILAYTLVLLFIQQLQRYSHLCCFSLVARLKPLVDAYTAPHVIRDSCRYWEGLLLFFRLILAVFFAVNIDSTTTSTNLVVIIFVCVVLLTVSWCVGGVYKKTHLNVLNSFFVLNLAALSLAINYTSSLKRNTRYFLYSTYTSYSLALLTEAVIIACHVYFQVRQWYIACRRHRCVEVPENDDNDILANLREF